MEKLASEWGFKDISTAEMFMRKRNKMVRAGKKKQRQQKMRDPSMRYNRIKEVAEKRAPLTTQTSPGANRSNLSLARTSLRGPPSRKQAGRAAHQTKGKEASLRAGGGGGGERARDMARHASARFDGGIDDDCVSSVSNISWHSDVDDVVRDRTGDVMGSSSHHVGVGGGRRMPESLGTMINNWSFHAAGSATQRTTRR